MIKQINKNKMKKRFKKKKKKKKKNNKKKKKNHLNSLQWKAFLPTQ